MGVEIGVQELPVNREQVVKVGSGAAMLPVVLLLWLGSFTLLIFGIVMANSGQNRTLEVSEIIGFGSIVSAILLFVLCIFLMPGFFTLQPNEAFYSRFPVVADFGQYKVYRVAD